MRIKSVQLNEFKRFTHLTIEGIPMSTKLVVLVGPNGSGKTSLFEAFNHYYKLSGFGKMGDYGYLNKGNAAEVFSSDDWYDLSGKKVNIDFHDRIFKPSYESGNVRGHFYFRSAYRNEPDFTLSSMESQIDPTSRIRLETLLMNDITVSNNYQRLVADSIKGLYEPTNNDKRVSELRDELTGIVRSSLTRVFDNLILSSLGNPLIDGSFYFKKGSIDSFHYRNLSAGEKAAFDLILDMVVQSKYYQDAVYCIDEPEAHMHTKLQGRVLRELYSLVPETSQLWVSTHAFGMLKEAEEIESQYPGTVVFLDFDNRDFDSDEIMRPAKINGAIRDKFYELALGDFAKLVLPEIIVFCEGNPCGGRNISFDKQVFTAIFADEHPNVQFISIGSSSEIENVQNKLGEIMSVLLHSSKIIKIVDGDGRSAREVAEFKAKDIKVLSKRHIEAYLLDDTIVRRLCESVNQTDKYKECILAKANAVQESTKRGNPIDDIKSAAGTIFNEFRKILQLTKCGSNHYSFLRDTMAPLITKDTDIYRQLEQDIFEQ